MSCCAAIAACTVDSRGGMVPKAPWD